MKWRLQVLEVNQKFQTIYNYCWDMHTAQVKYSSPIVNTYSMTINLIDILKMCSLQYLPSSSLLKMWNNLPLDLKRSNSLSIFKKNYWILFLKIIGQCVINRMAIHVKLIRCVLICNNHQFVIVNLFCTQIHVF